MLCAGAKLLLVFAAMPGLAQNSPLSITLPNPDGRDPSFDQSRAGERVDIEFVALEDNRVLTLRESEGSLRLINFWATWCVPCVLELPSLAALAAQHADAPFSVIPVSLDQKGAAGVPEFVANLGIDELTWFVDPTANSGQAADVFALPTTVIVDGNGVELGRVTGSADWQSIEATQLIEMLLNAHSR